jgi:hypothetical protein
MQCASVIRCHHMLSAAPPFGNLVKHVMLDSYGIPMSSQRVMNALRMLIARLLILRIPHLIMHI